MTATGYRCAAEATSRGYSRRPAAVAATLPATCSDGEAAVCRPDVGVFDALHRRGTARACRTVSTAGARCEHLRRLPLLERKKRPARLLGH